MRILFRCGKRMDELHRICVSIDLAVYCIFRISSFLLYFFLCGPRLVEHLLLQSRQMNRTYAHFIIPEPLTTSFFLFLVWRRSSSWILPVAVFAEAVLSILLVLDMRMAWRTTRDLIHSYFFLIAFSGFA
ncbi:hypothetical protein V8C44DRAFT_328895 [Trichoderma aethiopicum]